MEITKTKSETKFITYQLAEAEAIAYDGVVQKRLKWESSAGYAFFNDLLPFSMFVAVIIPILPIYLHETYFPKSEILFFILWIGSGFLFHYLYKLIMFVVINRTPKKINSEVLLSVLPILISKKVQTYKLSSSEEILDEILFLNRKFISLWNRAYFADQSINFLDNTGEHFKPYRNSIIFPLKNSSLIKNLQLIPWVEISHKSIRANGTMSRISEIFISIQKKNFHEYCTTALNIVGTVFYIMRNGENKQSEEDTFVLIERLDGYLEELPINQSEVPNLVFGLLNLTKQRIRKIFEITFYNDNFPVRLLSWFSALLIVLGSICYYVCINVLQADMKGNGVAYFLTFLGINTTLSIALGVNTRKQ